MANHTAFIETHTGGFFDYRNPRSENVNIVDIARALSNLCRFNGLIHGFYSVAEHALLVERLVREAGWADHICYAALHHDSHEAYLGDIPSPLKRELGAGWKRMEHRTDLAIGLKLGFDPADMEHSAIKWADQQALLMEAAKLKPSRGVGDHWNNDQVARVPPGAVRCFTPYQAEAKFLQRHTELAPVAVPA